MKKVSIILFALSMSLGLLAQTTIPSGTEVPCGKTVRITVTENEGYEFEHWSDITDPTDPNYAANPREVPVNGAVNLTAIFKLKDYTLVPSAFGGGVTLNGESTAITVKKGDEVTVFAKSEDACEEFKEWSDGNTDNPRVITYDPENLPTFTVTYKTKEFTVTAEAKDGAGTIVIEVL